MKSSLCCFETDIVHEGVDTVVRNAADRAGADGLTLAVAYHHGRDVFPHNPRGRALFLDGDTVAFQPDHTRYGPGVPQPRVSRLAREHDVLDVTTRAAHGSGLEVRAWVVYLHNLAIGAANSDLVVQNAYGDHDRTQLCPANPRVRQYAEALTGDVCRYPVQGILAESLHFHPFDYGYHHERDFLGRDGLTSFLLTLCFCRHCTAAGHALDVDVGSLATAVRSYLDRALVVSASNGGDSASKLAAEADALVGGSGFGGYLVARGRSVTALWSAVNAAAAAAGVPVFVVDPSGAIPNPLAGRAVDASQGPGWAWGVDLAGLGAGVEVEAIGYHHTAEGVSAVLSTYTTRGVRPGLALRPMHPDCVSADNLREKVAMARSHGVTTLDLYHYGLAPLEVLDWISAAIH
jgi:hypothetical protein